jgi:hypothetical protein
MPCTDVGFPDVTLEIMQHVMAGMFIRIAAPSV